MTGTGNGLDDAKRLIVKIGSALLVDQETGKVRREWLEALAADIAALRQDKREIVVVSSGAIAVGRRQLGLLRHTLKLEEKQAAAATGQIQLAHAYQETLGKHGIPVAQILLTLSDTEERRRHLNARNTLDTLLKVGCVPVVNENDTVATEEIRYGDNDRLGARVAQMISADVLILLSDIDGLYTADPRRDPSAEFISRVEDVTPEILAMAGAALPGYSSGGMVTKLEAAKIAMAAGCRMIIADGKKTHALDAVRRGGKATWFIPGAGPRTARKRWIAGHVSPAGAVTVDDGAVAALRAGRSLLPAGITAVAGGFDRGDMVLIQNAAGQTLGRGLIAYSVEDARLILGHKSREIEELLGYRGRDEMIHRDDLILD